jgi:hypothetical protein
MYAFLFGVRIVSVARCSNFGPLVSSLSSHSVLLHCKPRWKLKPVPMWRRYVPSLSNLHRRQIPTNGATVYYAPTDECVLARVLTFDVAVTQITFAITAEVDGITSAMPFPLNAPAGSTTISFTEFTVATITGPVTFVSLHSQCLLTLAGKLLLCDRRRQPLRQ